MPVHLANAACIALVGISSAVSVRADTLTTFDVTGAFNFPPGPPNPTGNLVLLSFVSTSNFDLDLVLPTAHGSLVGYLGGLITDGQYTTASFSGNVPPIADGLTGNISELSSVVTPVPASLWLFVGGVAMLALFGWLGRARGHFSPSMQPA
jgi:hypothetical protein